MDSRKSQSRLDSLLWPLQQVMLSRSQLCIWMLLLCRASACSPLSRTPKGAFAWGLRLAKVGPIPKLLARKPSHPPVSCLKMANLLRLASQLVGEALKWVSSLILGPKLRSRVSEARANDPRQSLAVKAKFARISLRVSWLVKFHRLAYEIEYKFRLAKKSPLA